MPHYSIDPVTGYVIAVVFVATIIRSTFGFGEALVSVPLLALRIPVVVAAPLAVMVSIVVAAVVVAQDWRRIEFRSAAGLIVTSLFGVPIGVLLLAAASDDVVKTTLGAIIVAFSIYSLTMARRRGAPRGGVRWLIACGFLAGVLGGAYGMNGPPLAVYGAQRQWSPRQFRATLQGYFLPVSIAGLAGYALIGLWQPPVIQYFLWSLPGVAVATLLGRVLNHRMNATAFVRFVYAGLIVIGTVLLVQGVRG